MQRLTGKAINNVERVGGGYSPALRLKLSLADGTSSFAKIGITPGTASALRQEQTVYQMLARPFMPRLLGWEDHPGNPILLLEDLSQAFWPPPWHQKRIERVLDVTEQVWASSLPGVPLMAEMPRIWDGWQQVAEDPVPFLSLGLASEKWLKQGLDTLLAIKVREVVDGRSLLHFDLRSDNICFVQDRTLIVDWNLVCLGNPQVDLGFWLPSLQAEGGPPPEKLLPNAGEIAGLVSGFFAARAGLPTIPEAPRVRHIQRVQLKTALPWAVRALNLPPLDGQVSG
ncbi:MAG: phosphotransferase [Anaerolineaceae bacterium]|nr:phosphotransferase [Anaerolineaceae bacterium]